MSNFLSTNTSTSTNKPKVFVGLSGGVDSAVSAALLQQQGYDVTGAFIRISIDGYPCTAGEDKLDAMRVAAHLKIPFVQIDLSEAYKKKVFELSVAEFAKGRTPNPDTLCNREIKFGLFFDWCVKLGADFVATGHYAQVKDGDLYMGVDPDKDQSYFLWAVPQTLLQKTIFPLGHLHKSDVRKLAEQFGLPNAKRPDSQGLCFLGPISITQMLERELAPTAGNVLDESGTVVGTHHGAALYTLGQRHGFGLSAQTPTTLPHFVIKKDIVANTIVVSTNKTPAGDKTVVELADTNWIGSHEEGKEYRARYRYRQKLISARFEGGKVVLGEPQYIPDGQSLVLYDDTRCLGGAVVEKSDVYAGI